MTTTVTVSCLTICPVAQHVPLSAARVNRVIRLRHTSVTRAAANNWKTRLEGRIIRSGTEYLYWSCHPGCFGRTREGCGRETPARPFLGPSGSDAGLFQRQQREEEQLGQSNDTTLDLSLCNRSGSR